MGAQVTIVDTVTQQQQQVVMVAMETGAHINGDRNWGNNGGIGDNGCTSKHSGYTCH